MLVAEQYFGKRAIPEDAAIRAARQANGMFLWAQSFLRNPALTPKTRHHFFSYTQKFDGLDGLFIAILHRLDEANHQAKEMTMKVFSWVGAAFYPLATEALYIALAIAPGDETTDLDYLVDFPARLPHLTGSLMGIDPFGWPAVIHLSVRELLTSSRCQVPDYFSLADATAIHGRLASVCLSHLTHDIPKKPIRKIQEGMHQKLTEEENKSEMDLQKSPNGQQGYDITSSLVHQSILGQTATVLETDDLGHPAQADCGGIG
ncbi:hypothetical protein LZ30DRAFT_714613 [Colletotrichum cereale]|nr:hypothetical protein LZ30DRAFT_714613 [Colletotrichum cereale]